MELTQRYRRHVAPYDVTSSLSFSASTNYCPALQKMESNVYIPDRAIVPTLIVAEVAATSKDDSGSIQSVASDDITNIKWMVQCGDETQGADITTHADWTGKFTIGTGADKGKLTVRMNVPAGTTWRIWMECTISDRRRGYTVAIPVVTDSVLLYTIAQADDQYTMSIDRPSGEIYEPARDQRLICEYLTGLGQSPALNDDDKTYLRTVTAKLRQGGTEVAPSAYALKVYSVDSVGIRTEVTASVDPCINSIVGQVVTFDLRFAQNKTYQIACCVGANEACRKTYGWAWTDEMPTTDEGLVGGATYADGKTQTYRPKLNLGTGVLEYPTIGFDLKWYWRKPGQTAKNYVGGGEQHEYDLTNSAMFNGSEAEAVLTVERRGAFDFVGDGTDVYDDGNGNLYIEN